MHLVGRGTMIQGVSTTVRRLWLVLMACPYGLSPPPLYSEEASSGQARSKELKAMLV